MKTHRPGPGQANEPGLNIGWSKGPKVVWLSPDRNRKIYFRFRLWPPRIFLEIRRREAGAGAGS